MSTVMVKTDTLKAILEEVLEVINSALEDKKKKRLEYFSIKYQRRWRFRIFGGLVTPEIIESFYNVFRVDNLFNPWQWYSLENEIYHLEEEDFNLSKLLLICMHPEAKIMSIDTDDFAKMLRYLNDVD